MFKKLVMLCVAYIGIVLVYFLFSFATIYVDSLARIDQSVRKPYLALVIEGDILVGEIISDVGAFDTDGRFQTREPKDLGDVGVWLFALHGFSEIRKYSFAKNLGVNVESLIQNQASEVIISNTASISLRWSFLPLFVDQKKVVIVDIQYFREAYRTECLMPLMYGYATAQVDPEFVKSCTI